MKPSLKSAFMLNLFTILFFVLSGFFFELNALYCVAFVFLMLLPNCSTTR